MISRTLFRWALIGLLSFATVSPALADSSHARIIRLSLVEGDVRFARDVHGDPLTSDKAAWEAAELNLPIRQGYVLATDKGRAVVEFENGAMALLAENTMLEFYDLSLAENGEKTTRLVLRQGTASFYVNPASGDYFSVTGGDFTVEAVDRTNFRIDDFDDGSAVNVSKGQVSLRRKDKTTELAKGQSFSMRANDDTSVSVGRSPEDDDFDRWVSGRIDSVANATAAAQQYVNSPYYSSGLADLYTYGSWYPVAGYGNCWRPYGVGLGWSPFASGGWFMDPSFGWSFIGNQPWGWLPYHYGGWVFDPVFGWVWTPGFGFGGFYGGFVPWRPVTGIWVRSKPGLLGIVPVHPLDVHGKTPINIGRGIFPVTGGSVARNTLAVDAGERWKPVRSVPRNVLTTTVVASAPPAHVPRTIITASNPGLRSSMPSAGHSSSIVYDAGERRYVNRGDVNRAPVNGHIARPVQPAAPLPANGAVTINGAPAKDRFSPAPAAPTRPIVVAAPRVMTPPPAPRAADGAGGRAGSFGGAGGGAGGMRYEPHAATGAVGAVPAPGSSAPHAAAPAAATHAASPGHH